MKQKIITSDFIGDFEHQLSVALSFGWKIQQVMAGHDKMWIGILYRNDDE